MGGKEVENLRDFGWSSEGINKQKDDAQRFLEEGIKLTLYILKKEECEKMVRIGRGAQVSLFI